MFRSHRSALLLCTALSGIFAFALPAAAAEQTFQFNIPAEPLGQALTDFSRIASQQIVFSEGVASGRTTPGLHGVYTPQNALKALLTGTDLEVDTSSGVVMVRQKKAKAALDNGAAEPATVRVASNEPAPASSEAPTAPQASSDRHGAGPEEIIVTARKREESIMRTPVIIQAIPQTQIENLHITSIESLTSVAPGTFIHYGLAQTGIAAYVRGIGNSPSATYADQSISLNIDGFTSAQGALFRQGVFDAAQIEVLKGPQSLFFGKSTAAGMIAVHSADPTKDWQAEAKIGYEFKADEMDLSGYVSGPLTDTLGIRIAGYHNTSKGYLYSPNPANPAHRVPAEDDNGGRLTLKYDNPDVGLRVKFKASYTHDSLNIAYFEFNQQVCAGPTNPSKFLPYDNCRLDLNTAGLPNGLPYSSTANFAPGGAGFLTNTPEPIFKDGKSYAYTSTALAVLNVDYDVAPGLTLSSVTGLDYFKAVDAGRNVTAIGPVDIGTDPKFHEFSQELRLTSDWKDRWYNFMLGGLYNPARRNDQLILSYPTGGLFLTDVLQDGLARFKSETDGAFGQVLLTPLRQWELSAGVRYSHVRRTVTSLEQVNNLGANSGVDIIPLLGPGQNSINEHAWTPEVTLSYRPTDDLTAFISYKRGYKGPAWNSALTNSPGITVANFLAKPFVHGEKAKGVEGGIKAKLLNGQLALTASGYYYDYDNLQVAFYLLSLNTAIIQNGANARVQGFELGGDYSPDSIPGLTLSAFMNYNDTHYTSFTNAPCYNGESVGAGCINHIQDLAGKPSFFAPKFVGNLGASYKWDVSDKYTASVDAQVQYTGAYYGEADLNPYSHQKGYALLNAAIHLAKSDKAWDIALLCRNCTNKIYIVNGQDGGLVVPAANEQIGRPQQVLLELTLHPNIL
jgi:outer membrane receptor protein involved in Fe transport